MHNSTRRTLVTGAATSVATSALIPRWARAAEFNYKFANNLPLTHPMNVRAKEAVERIREETSGRVEIQIFPSSQLGSDSDVLSQVRSGGVEFFTLAGALLATLVPFAAIDGIPYAFPDYKTVWQAIDGAAGASVAAWVTLSSTTSWSQSRRISCTVCTWPDSSPLNPRRARERL